MDVVVEISTNAAPLVQTGSRADRIAGLKAVFERDCAPVEQAIRGVGGEVTGRAWINQTMRARVPAGALGELSSLEEVQHLDLPRALEAEGA